MGGQCRGGQGVSDDDTRRRRDDGIRGEVGVELHGDLGDEPLGS